MARFFPLIATSNEAVSHDGNGLCDLLCRRMALPQPADESWMDESVTFVMSRHMMLVNRSLCASRIRQLNRPDDGS
jgi:hypothetical protein